MSRRPLGEVAMTVAERSRRKRQRAKAQAVNGKLVERLPNSEHVGNFQRPAEPASTPPATDLLAGGPEAIAARIFERVPVEMARDIAMALQQRLLQGGCWPSWRMPML